MDEQSRYRARLAEGATDDRFLSFEFLSYEMEAIAQAGREGDARAMCQALEKLREWQQRFARDLRQLEAVVADFDALDDLCK